MHLGAEDRAEIRRLHAEGLSKTEISRRVGAAFNTVTQALEARPEPQRPPEHPQRIQLSIDTGIVIVASDGHYWPGPPSTVHRALVKFCRDLQPAAFILNGDAFDGASVSRHPPIGWEHVPTVAEELAACQERLAEIESALPPTAQIAWPIGNHDQRMSTRLATVAPEFANVHGVRLKDHFPSWPTAWSVFLNNDVVVKHRFKGGVHAPYNNTLHSGRTLISGHLHSAKVIPVTDYNGTRFGMDTGCIADPEHQAFTDYTEDGPKNWVSAFGVLTLYKGRLLWPELVVKWSPTQVQFRGTVIEV